ncbi:hypothetical protein ACFLTS_05265 [Chloroflexota bacterium]
MKGLDIRNYLVYANPEMADFKVELHYYDRDENSYAWQHRKIGEKVEIEQDEVLEIGLRFGVTINISEGKKSFFILTDVGEKDPGQFIPKAHRLVITIHGEDEFKVRECVRSLLKTYGVPDDVPKGIWGSKKKGAAIARSVLEELGIEHL